MVRHVDTASKIVNMRINGNQVDARSGREQYQVKAFTRQIRPQTSHHLNRLVNSRSTRWFDFGMRISNGPRQCADTTVQSLFSIGRRLYALFHFVCALGMLNDVSSYLFECLITLVNGEFISWMQSLLT